MTDQRNVDLVEQAGDDERIRAAAARHNVKVVTRSPRGVGGGHPNWTLTGEPADLDALLRELGWEES